MIKISRDSANPYTITVRKRNSTDAVNISAFVLRFELYQSGTTITLTIGNGLAFVDNGADGRFTFLLRKAQANQFSIGIARARAFDDSGATTNGDPLLLWEGTAVIEGKTFDA